MVCDLLYPLGPFKSFSLHLWSQIWSKLYVPMVPTSKCYGLQCIHCLWPKFPWEWPCPFSGYSLLDHSSVCAAWCLLNPPIGSCFCDVFTQVTCPVLEVFPGWWRKVLFSTPHRITSWDPLRTSPTPALPKPSLLEKPFLVPPLFLIHNIPRKVTSFISACLLSGEADTKQGCFLSQLHCFKAMRLLCTSVPRI